MKTKIDKTADALYVTLKKGKVHTTKPEDGCLVDYDKNGNVLGFEVIGISKKKMSGRKVVLPAMLKR